MSTSRQQPSRANHSGYPDNHAFRREVRGQNEGHFVQGGWPLARISKTDNNPDVVDDVLSSYSTNFPNPTMSQQSASQTPQYSHLNSTRSTSVRRHTFRPRDSVTAPPDEFSQSDNSFVRAHRHPFWQIEAKLWPNDGLETDIDIASLTFQLPQFIYQGLGNGSQDVMEMIKDSKLRWFHLPMNNLEWVKDLIRRLSILDGKSLSQYKQLIDNVENSLFEIGEDGNISKSREPACYRLQTGREEFVSTVMPYLNHEAYGARKILLDRVQNGVPVANQAGIPGDIKERVDRAAALAVDYGNLVHLPKTLDGSYYLGLKESDMSLRDDDQCVSKDWERRNTQRPGEEIQFHNRKPIAMVHQIWLWVIDDRTVVSAFTERMASDERSLFQFLEHSLQSFTERLYINDTEIRLPTSKSRPANLLIQEFVSRCTNFLDRPYLAGFADPLFSSFDNVIGGVSEEVTRKYSNFRKSLEVPDGPDDEFRDTVNIKITRESELLLDIRDVRDELSMVRNVFCQQRDVLEDMSTELLDNKADIHNTISLRSSCIPRVSKFLRRLQLIDENAENVERAIQHLLDLKQKRANLNEACNTADQTRFLANQAYNTTRQGKIILAFTVVTVFFTPLSWVSAIFTVNIDNGKPYQPWQVVLGEFASLLFTILIVWLAFLKFDQGSNKSKEQAAESTRNKPMVASPKSSIFWDQGPLLYNNHKASQQRMQHLA